MFSKTLTINNLLKILGANMLFGFATPIALAITFHDNSFYWSRAFSVSCGFMIGWLIVTCYIIWQTPGTPTKSVLPGLLAYPLCVFCSLFIVYASGTSVIYTTGYASQQRIGTGLTWVWLSESVEDYRIPWNLDGKTVHVSISFDSTKILDIYREYPTSKAYVEAIEMKVLPLLNVPMPQVDKTLSLACQICSVEPFMDSLKQRIDDLHIPGLIVHKFDESYLF